MESETAELFSLAASLSARAPGYQLQFDALIHEMRAGFDVAKDASLRERLSEKFSQSLRHLWIEASVASTSRNYRSPPIEQKTRTATGRSIEFGYERDLHPTYLEERCARFFGDSPQDWTSDHVLLSSGQSAMAATLHALEGGSLIGGNRKLSFVHLGAYFETAEVFSLFRSLLQPIGRGRAAVTTMSEWDADVFIIEPVFCDGEFGAVDVTRLIDQHRRKSRRRVYIFDTTLTGTTYSLQTHLDRLRPLEPPAVFRLVSGLKLLQGGLELSNVGVLSVFTPGDAPLSARQIGDRIRKIRTLLGLGLSFADVAVLEAPWFLDREYTSLYQHAIFENNARLANAVSTHNRGFRGLFHPTMLPQWQGPHKAPYCVFRIESPDAQAYARLEERIREEVRIRDILFEAGGSFGFRGHRFEVVHPEDGTETFLRVALGRRSGRSCDQIIELFQELASEAQ
jgi:hypothetical protein